MADWVVFGVDVGGSAVKCGLFTAAGSLLEKWSIPSRTVSHGQYILPDIAASLQEVIDRLEIPIQAILGVGLGVPGPVLPDGRVNRCVNLGWEVCTPARTLSALTHLPVKVANDANAAALGEFWQGSGKGYGSLYFVAIGTGIGGGFVSDGKILTGANGAAGEIGHSPAGGNLLCTCGNRGCLETIASAAAIAKAAPDSTMTARDVMAAAKAGEAWAAEIVAKAASALGKALAFTTAVADPEVFVIGGGLSGAGSFLLDQIRAAYQQYAFHASADTPFAIAALGADAGIYGCAALVL